MRSIVVAPSATSPAITRQADARRSVAITLAPVSCADAFDDRGAALDLDVGAEALQLLHVHHPVLEDRLGDHGRAVGDRHQRHELRLHVGRERRIRRGAQIDRLQCPVPRYADRVAVGGDLRAGLRKLLEHRLERRGAGPAKAHLAAGRGGSGEERARLDPVGHDRVRMRR